MGIYAVGTDHNLYYRADLSTSGWGSPLSIDNSVLDIAVLQDGTLLCVDTSNNLKTRNADGSWNPIGGSGSVTNIAVIPANNQCGWSAGSILGIGMGNNLWVSAYPSVSWAQQTTDGRVKAVAFASNGTLYGIDKNTNQPLIYSQGTWTQVPSNGQVTSIAFGAGGQMYGVGLGNMLWKAAVGASINWVQVPGQTGSVIAVDLQGVGTD